ncbi:PAS domain-containing protein [bacterium]|nr:PAS domain-containing protein [bacterium]
MKPLTESEKQELLALVEAGRPLPPQWRDRLFPPGPTSSPAAAVDENEALRQSEARYRAIVEDQIDFVCRFLPDGTLTFVNEAMCRFVGLPREDLLGRSFLPFLPTEDRKCLLSLLQSATPTRPVVNAEHRANKADGTRGWLQWIDRALYDEQGRLVEFQGVGRDITRHKHAEEELQQAHEELKALWDALPDLIFEVDRAGRIYSYHAMHPDLFYVPPQDFLGKTMALLLPDTAARVIGQALAEASQTGRHVGGIYFLDLPVGRRWFELSIAAKGDHRLAAARFVALVRDITERKQAEEALQRAHDELEQRVADRTAELRESQERFELFMRHLPAVAFAKDRRGRYVFVNEAWKKLFPKTTSVGCLDSDVWPAATAAQLRANDRLVMRTCRPVQVVEHVPQADGVHHWLVTKFPILDAAGHPILLGGAAVDITELRRLEEALLQISEREQRRIAQDLHDGLCQDLTGTAFLVRALHRRLVDHHHGPAEAARRVADLLETAIEDARRLSQGLHPVPPDPEGLQHALGQLATTVTDLFAVRCRARFDRPVLVENNATATHLFRIAQEAVSNAIKHGRAKQVLITLSRRREGLELVVRDNGRGLPRKLPAGDGMGLQIMQYRAAAIGATLQVNRAGRRGTVVTCTVRGAGGRPRARARNRRGPPPNTPRAGSKVAAATPRARLPKRRSALGSRHQPAG